MDGTRGRAARFRSPLVLLALPVLVVAWIGWSVIGFLTSDNPLDSASKVPCDEAMEFTGVPLPAGARDRRCVTRVWLDTEYDVRFRITRKELDAWLESEFPGTELDPKFCAGEVDTCAHIEFGDQRPSQAVAADVSVVYEGGGTALVHFEPFDV
ncbi:hypothetical protein OHA79_22750 [Streptomyces sp. NBC_00841]|uniref:hypothetical protein n=1 Tax=unclassified Streptomyces TaxID=2593676 RepID=UPI002252AEB1|nr:MULTISPECIES: hypothetical protein [unclassified Streptomyces]MCX4534215.1 hypothetical protein [Streptomyces sp. NBC_01669]WSA00421.1 hypothetical protein OHA79_22750 [Streptomyces sp. NBC_00841]